MRRRVFHAGFVLGCIGLAVQGIAQQGHPLTGTWNGDWGASPTERRQITVVMTWDGKAAKAVINPGPDSATGTALLDPVNWMVRIEADVKDAAGKLVHLVAEGKMDDMGSYHRTLAGSWRQGTTNGNFKLTRD
jgi:hypothetical protein